MIYQGSATEFSFRHALAWQNGVQFELVQPLAGPSIFVDHLKQHGPGLHHIGAYVPDHAAAVWRPRMKDMSLSRAPAASGRMAMAPSPISRPQEYPASSS